MAKNKTNNNDLFSNFKAPKIEKTIVEEKVPEVIVENTREIESINTLEEVKEVTPVIPVTPTSMPQTILDTTQYVVPRSGRPKVLEGKYHNYTARIREDLFKYAQSRSGNDSEYQSVNDYINQLILKDMLSHIK